jgi:hypothetical protein
MLAEFLQFLFSCITSGATYPLAVLCSPGTCL